MIAYAQTIGLRVALKPTANCANGVWRAHINFFDEDVPCEPKWRNWFASYMDFQRHYAKIAQEMGCEMHIAGCEMVMSERRCDEWRATIAEIRKEFQGLVSYNTDPSFLQRRAVCLCTARLPCRTTGRSRVRLIRMGRQNGWTAHFAPASSARGVAALPSGSGEVICTPRRRH